MKLKTLILLLVTHATAGTIGVAVGIYALPILIAPPAPTESQIAEMTSQAEYTAEFRKDLKGSDSLHWGEGRVLVGPNFVALTGTLAPGPDYKLYLSREFVETEADFNRLKPGMVRVGDVKTFQNFLVNVPVDVDPSEYTTVVVWCEAFGEFITSAKYR